MAVHPTHAHPTLLRSHWEALLERPLTVGLNSIDERLYAQTLLTSDLQLVVLQHPFFDSTRPCRVQVSRGLPATTEQRLSVLSTTAPPAGLQLDTFALTHAEMTMFVLAMMYRSMSDGDRSMYLHAAAHTVFLTPYIHALVAASCAMPTLCDWLPLLQLQADYRERRFSSTAFYPLVDHLSVVELTKPAEPNSMDHRPGTALSMQMRLFLLLVLQVTANQDHSPVEAHSSFLRLRNALRLALDSTASSSSSSSTLSRMQSNLQRVVRPHYEQAAETVMRHLSSRNTVPDVFRTFYDFSRHSFRQSWAKEATTPTWCEAEVPVQRLTLEQLGCKLDLDGDLDAYCRMASVLDRHTLPEVQVTFPTRDGTATPAYSEKRTAFVVPGVSAHELQYSLKRHEDVVRLLIRCKPEDDQVADCIDSNTGRPAAVLVRTPSWMFVYTLVSRMQALRHRATVAAKSAALELLAMALPVVGLEGAWVLLMSMFHDSDVLCRGEKSHKEAVLSKAVTTRLGVLVVMWIRVVNWQNRFITVSSVTLLRRMLHSVCVRGTILCTTPGAVKWFADLDEATEPNDTLPKAWMDLLHSPEVKGPAEEMLSRELPISRLVQPPRVDADSFYPVGMNCTSDEGSWRAFLAIAENVLGFNGAWSGTPSNHLLWQQPGSQPVGSASYSTMAVAVNTTRHPLLYRDTVTLLQHDLFSKPCSLDPIVRSLRECFEPAKRPVPQEEAPYVPSSPEYDPPSPKKPDSPMYAPADNDDHYSSPTSPSYNQYGSMASAANTAPPSKKAKTSHVSSSKKKVHKPALDLDLDSSSSDDE